MGCEDEGIWLIRWGSCDEGKGGIVGAIYLFGVVWVMMMMEVEGFGERLLSDVKVCGEGEGLDEV